MVRLGGKWTKGQGGFGAVPLPASEGTKKGARKPDKKDEKVKDPKKDPKGGVKASDAAAKKPKPAEEPQEEEDPLAVAYGEVPLATRANRWAGGRAGEVCGWVWCGVVSMCAHMHILHDSSCLQQIDDAHEAVGETG